VEKAASLERGSLLKGVLEAASLLSNSQGNLPADFPLAGHEFPKRAEAETWTLVRDLNNAARTDLIAQGSRRR
jgi:hypothetical protein